MRPGDEYTIEWCDGDKQRYCVQEMRGDDIVVYRRWLKRGEWSPWLGVLKLSRLPTCAKMTKLSSVPA